jgi:hypothetical protein
MATLFNNGKTFVKWKHICRMAKHLQNGTLLWNRTRLQNGDTLWNVNTFVEWQHINTMAILFQNGSKCCHSIL